MKVYDKYREAAASVLKSDRQEQLKQQGQDAEAATSASRKVWWERQDAKLRADGLIPWPDFQENLKNLGIPLDAPEGTPEAFAFEQAFVTKMATARGGYQGVLAHALQNSGVHPSDLASACKLYFQILKAIKSAEASQQQPGTPVLAKVEASAQPTSREEFGAVDWTLPIGNGEDDASTT